MGEDTFNDFCKIFAHLPLLSIRMVLVDELCVHLFKQLDVFILELLKQKIVPFYFLEKSVVGFQVRDELEVDAAMFGYYP